MSKLVSFNAIAAADFNPFDELIGAAPAEAATLNPTTHAVRLAVMSGRQATDPAQQATVLESFRTSIRSHLPEIAELIGLDSTLEDRLIELLAQQQWTELCRLQQQQRTERRGSSMSLLGDMAAARGREQAAIRELLGEASFRRYLQYLATLVERRKIAEFDARLGGHALTRLQKDSMIAALTLRNRQFRARMGGIDTTVPPSKVMDPRALSAESLLRDLEASRRIIDQQLLEITEEVSRELVAATACFLTPAQLAVFAQMESARIAGRRKQLGLAVETQPSGGDRSGRRVPVIRRPLHWAVQLRINQQPPQLWSFAGASEQEVTFEAAEGLQIDALPRAYEDGRLCVELLVYEADRDDRQFIGMLADTVPLRPVFTAEFTSSGGSVLAGSKGYAITMSVTGSLLPGRQS